MKYSILTLTAGLVLSLCSCNQQSNSSDKPKEVSVPVQDISATADQQERRDKSEAICKLNEIPIYENPNSLFVAPESEVTIRTKDEIVDRTIALLYIGLKSEGLEQEHLDRIDKDFNVLSKLTPKEKEYALADNPTQQQQVNANWRYESLHVLLWSLGYIDSLSYPSHICNVGDDVKIIYELGEENFRAQAKLRSKQEILDQTDLALRFHWACVSARVKNEGAPGQLDSSVVYERHYSLNWLTQYMKQDWDNVSTDT